MPDYSDPKIRIATTDPSLKDKISVRLIGDNLEQIHWYIRFSAPLDPATVTAKNMDVTDTEGYIMRTVIRYDADRNMIALSPLDSYMEGLYYILHISKKVKSDRGKPLGKEVYVLFKLLDGKISEYELLKSTVKPPKPVPRPKNYDNMMVKRHISPAQHANKEKEKAKYEDKSTIPYKEININILISLTGLAGLIASLYFNIGFVIPVAIAISLLGVAHIVKQTIKPAFRARVRYNIGAVHFNKGRYEKAKNHLRRAYRLNPKDEDVEHALYRLKFHE
ncbi:MAG: tetratricopeptide repeat protein [Defluviitaleaceae bacterium]|nr:tetratricopeptide repeat protein [Defluviitaleaceae bacterium]